jgi:hypothetical protein
MLRIYNRLTRKKNKGSASNGEPHSEKEDKSLVYATWGLVIVTGILAYYTYKLFDEAAYSSTHALEETKKAIAETKESNRISRIALKITKSGIDSSNAYARTTLQMAQQNFKIENRPYLYIKGLTENNLEVGGNFYMSGTLVNVGKVHALNVRVKSYVEYHTMIYYDKIRDDSLGIVKVGNISPQSETFVSTYPEVLSQRRYDLIANKVIYPYFFGRISYTDVFGGDYFTTFCFIYNRGNTPEFILNTSFNNVK